MKASKLANITQIFLVFQFLALGSISSCSQSNWQASATKENPKSVKLTVSAAASMQDVLQEIEQLYLKKYPQAEITFNFGSSGSLQRQIEQGAPIDLFISAAPEQMDNLAAKELLIAETRQDLVKNQMVLIVQANNNSISDFQDLSKKSTEQVALGEPNSVPAGKYAREILANLDLVDEIKSKAVYGKDVRQVLNYVATGNVDAGIVYSTDTVKTRQVKIVAAAPEKTHSPVVYPVAIVKDSNNSQAAKQMLEFLFTPEAGAIFEKHGFTSIGKS